MTRTTEERLNAIEAKLAEMDADPNYEAPASAEDKEPMPVPQVIDGTLTFNSGFPYDTEINYDTFEVRARHYVHCAGEENSYGEWSEWAPLGSNPLAQPDPENMRPEVKEKLLELIDSILKPILPENAKPHPWETTNEYRKRAGLEEVATVQKDGTTLISHRGRTYKATRLGYEETLRIRDKVVTYSKHRNGLTVEAIEDSLALNKAYRLSHSVSFHQADKSHGTLTLEVPVTLLDDEAENAND